MENIDWNTILMAVVPAVVTLILGFFANNPKYIKIKKIIKLISTALEDNKLTADELKQIINLLKEGKAKDAHNALKCI